MLVRHVERPVNIMSEVEEEREQCATKICGVACGGLE